jgi:hypothetical protein
MRLLFRQRHGPAVVKPLCHTAALVDNSEFLSLFSLKRRQTAASTVGS